MFYHCRPKNAPTSCFHILKTSNKKINRHDCYFDEITLDEVDMLDESLMTENLPNNRLLLSKTNRLMPNFVENLIKYFQ